VKNAEKFSKYFKMMAIIQAQREVKSFYKKFLKLARKFPKQETRSTKIQEFIINNIRFQFRNSKQDLDRAQSELAALNKIVHADISALKLSAYLPPKDQYELLDTVAQNIIKHPSGALNYFGNYLTGVTGRSK
jgi:hypothetical protein